LGRNLGLPALDRFRGVAAAGAEAGAEAGAAGGAAETDAGGGAAAGRPSNASTSGDEAGNVRSPGCHSFDPATPVLMADGTTKTIATIAVGDQVLAKDPVADKQQHSEPVIALHINHDSDLTDVTVETSDGRHSTIHTTRHHLLWNDTQHRWVPAGDLAVDDQLQSPNGTALRVRAVVTVTGTQEMRDLTVAHIHTYYVIVGTTPVLVDNCPEDVPPSNDTTHSTLRGGAGDRGLDANEIMRNAQKIYYDENGNQVYVFNQGNGATQVTIRNPGNGNIVTNMNSTDGYVDGKLESGDWFELN
jgi:hypothetical protein